MCVPLIEVEKLSFWKPACFNSIGITKPVKRKSYVFCPTKDFCSIGASCYVIIEESCDRFWLARWKDWKTRFGEKSLGLNFLKVSGEDEITESEWKKAHVILTTPEKVKGYSLVVANNAVAISKKVGQHDQKFFYRE